MMNINLQNLCVYILFAATLQISPVYAAFEEGVPPANDDGGLVAVAASSDLYIAVGSFSKVLQSSDGINWSKQTVPDNGMTTYKNFRDMAYGGGKFIGVTQQGVIYTSSDGETWTGKTITVNTDVTPDLTASAVNGSTFYVTGNYFDGASFAVKSAILKSTDGLSWSVSATIDANLHSLAWDGSQLIAGGSSGEIFTSSDGSAWVKQSSAIIKNLTVTGIASNENDLIVATGWQRSLATSPDGENWTAVNHRQDKVPSELAIGWSDVIWTGNGFVIVGDNGIISSSSDGSTWTDDETFIGQMQLKGIASIGDQIVAVGQKPKSNGGNLSALVYSGAASSVANSSPSSNAGSDQTVTENTTVTLSGSASDSDGSISTYLWAQSSGTSVILSATDTASSSFTAPAVTASETLVFTLTATDNAGASVSDQVSITVNPAGSSTPTTGGPSTPTSTASSSGGAVGLIEMWMLLLAAAFIRHRK